ncbi:tRNA-specific adenosine deaminase TAD3 isoform X2 [Benincasa hispida]|uniref:tRNA-specific adenosine deaminase TAD3 isoform X2 n=1 Tax=Benincasa hispida TaxID=102211 RepID=UPI001902BD9B|nr:tRNA-specific adenosine deaminase TAD3 isoform X2 [Benincasa hispida]
MCTRACDVIQVEYLYHKDCVTQVCKEAATTKEEWEEQCKLWPTSYHPPTYNIDGITGFNEVDTQSIFGFMRLAIELAQSSNKSVVNAAVIVDPSVKQVIASACDHHISSKNASTSNVNGETIFKKCLKSIGCHFDSNGSIIHGTLPSSSLLKTLKQSCSDVSCLYPLRWVDLPLLHSSNSCCWHPLRHAAIAAIESSAARDRHLFPTLKTMDDKSVEMEHMGPLTKLAKRQKIDLENAKRKEEKVGIDAEGTYSKSDRPYLCTGYDIYLVWEPCIMCAMALVHQRVRRIFYAFPNPSHGALGSVHRLQGERSLNHHYAVFRVLFHEDEL